MFHERARKKKVERMNAAPIAGRSALFGSRGASRCQPRLERTAGAKADPCQRVRRRPVRSCRWRALTIRRLREFSSAVQSETPRLIVTQQRARAIGIETSTPMALSLPRAADAAAYLRPRCRQQEPFHRGRPRLRTAANGGHPARQAGSRLAGDPRGARDGNRQ